MHTVVRDYKGYSGLGVEHRNHDFYGVEWDREEVGPLG